MRVGLIILPTITSFVDAEVSALSESKFLQELLCEARIPSGEIAALDEI